MFKLEDIRKTRVWQEAHGEGREEGKLEERQEVVHKMQANGLTQKRIAAILGVSVEEVRRLAKKTD